MKIAILCILRQLTIKVLVLKPGLFIVVLQFNPGHHRVRSELLQCIVAKLSNCPANFGRDRTELYSKKNKIDVSKQMRPCRLPPQAIEFELLSPIKFLLDPSPPPRQPVTACEDIPPT